MSSPTSKYAPVFPLPGFSLFPGTTSVFHIFEKRYKEMVSDALEGDKLIALALLKPGYEEHYYGNPEIYPVGCLGRITKHEVLENGNYNIVVEGLERVGFSELVQDYPYRVSSLHSLPEKDLSVDFESQRQALLQRLGYLAEHADESVDFNVILTASDTFLSLVNLVAKTLPLTPQDQYSLISMDSLEERAAKVLWYLDDQIETLELLKQIDPQSTDAISLN
jgi:hypothetical protein